MQIKINGAVNDTGYYSNSRPRWTTRYQSGHA